MADASVADQFGGLPAQRLKPGQIELPAKLVELNSDDLKLNDRPIFISKTETTKSGAETEKYTNQAESRFKSLLGNKITRKPLAHTHLGNTVKKENVTGN